MKILTNRERSGAIEASSMLRRLSCVLLLWCVASAAHAAPIYKCVDAQGHLTFRDTPCATHARQTKLDVSGQPLIDPSAPRQTASVHTRNPSSARSQGTRNAPRSRARQRKQPMSWECRAADGEVFYRHTRCPGSVPGDGVVRDHWRDDGSERTARRRNAWGNNSVHGKKIPRTEACRRIHAAGAAGRDGHLRDATVSTYDHLMGRDPCDGN